MMSSRALLFRVVLHLISTSLGCSVPHFEQYYSGVAICVNNIILVWHVAQQMI